MTIIPTIDVVEKLSSNREQYTGEEPLKLERGWLPSYLEYCFDRLQCEVDPEPNLDTTIACCVSHGIEVIRSNADIQELLRLKKHIKEKLDAADAEKIFGFADDVEEIFGFRSVPVSALVGIGPSSKTPNTDYKRILLPGSVKRSVSRLAKELSASPSVIVVLSSMIILSTQRPVRGRWERLNDSVLFFFHKVRLRKKVAEAFLLTLDELPSNRQGSDSKRRNLR
jgi:hypothetical protein